MPTDESKPTSATPSATLPADPLPVTPKGAKRMLHASFALGIVALVANGLTMAAFMPVLGMQIAAFVAGTCTGVSWYIARRVPTESEVKNE